MKISLDVSKVKSHSTYKGSIKVRIKIGQYLVVNTERANLCRGVYAFLEKHIIKMDYDDTSYIEVSLLSDINQVLSEITVFFRTFKSNHKISMEGPNESKYDLIYEVKEIEEQQNQHHMKMKNLKSKSFMDDDFLLQDEIGKPEILRMGVLMYNFSQRLDPMVYLYAKIRNVLLWQNPALTLAIGILLTIMLLNLKMSILIGGIALYCYRNVIIKKLEKVQKYKKTQKRLMVPDQNVFLVQQMMDSYCDIYEQISQLLFKHDKTLLINGIKIICKVGIVLILLLLILKIEHLIAVTVWIVLILSSPISKTITKMLRPALVTLVSEYTKIMDKIAKEIRSILIYSRKQQQKGVSARQFYVYQYERYYLFSGWQSDNPKFSGKDFECEATMNRQAPKGWCWTNNWELDTSQDCDEQGYQYSNDFITYFTSDLLLANRRRRKWRRYCMKQSP